MNKEKKEFKGYEEFVEDFSRCMKKKWDQMLKFIVIPFKRSMRS